MNINLLLVSVDDFPQKVLKNLSEYGFHCIQARGRLKVNEILKNHSIGAIIWYLEGYESSFANDLIQIFNEQTHLPLAILTKYYRSYPFKDDIKNRFIQFDLNDDINETAQAIDGLCNQKPQTKNSGEESDYFEMDFKHVLSNITNRQIQNDQQQPSESAIKFNSSWVAVDNKEKEFLSNQDVDNKGMIRSKVKRWINRIV